MSGGGRIDDDHDEEGFAPSRRRATDEVHEQRQLRPTKQREGLDGWLDDVLWGGLEVSFVTMPVMIPFALFTTASVAKTGLAVGFFTFVLAIGTVRGEWLDVGAPWPRVTGLLAGLRLVYYNGAMVVVYLGSGAITNAVGVDATAVVVGVVLAGLLGLAFPRVAAPLDPWQE